MRFALLLPLVCSLGCTHMQLRRSTNSQIKTVSGVYQRQVLHNVAKVCVNPDAIPDFSTVTQGTTQVNDSGQGAVGFSWNPTTLVAEALDLGASRSVSQQWDNQPVNDPSRIKAMWAVYYYTVYGDFPETERYSGEKQLEAVFGPLGGAVPNLPLPGWFASGKKIECGLNECCPTGSYCGNHVWLCEGGEHALHQLTLAMLHIANYQPVGDDAEGKLVKLGFPTGIKDKTSMFGPGAPPAAPAPAAAAPRYREFFSLPQPGLSVTN